MNASTIKFAMEDEQFLYKCLLLMHERQTGDEQVESLTKHRNHRGFTAADGGFLTDAADSLLRDGYLSQSAIHETRLRMQKYAKQLSTINDLEL